MTELSNPQVTNKQIHTGAAQLTNDPYIGKLPLGWPCPTAALAPKIDALL